MTYGKPTGTFNELMAQRAELIERIEKLKTAPRVVQIETSNALEARVNWIDHVIADSCPVNALLANEREYIEEAESAFTQAVGYAALGTFGLLFALCLIP